MEPDHNAARIRRANVEKVENAKPRAGEHVSEEHTPGPWHIAGADSDQIRANDTSIADIRWNGHNEKHGIANARRIVACVNACEGLSTEQLECGLFHSGPAALAERDALAAQNRELVEALRLAETLRPKMLKGFGYVPEYVLDFCNNARALLAKVRL